MGIEWNDSLLIGYEEIDNQHKELVKHFDNLLNACESGKGAEELLTLLGFLDGYVVKHFNDEEMIQTLFNYPEYQLHREEHTQFVAKLDLLNEEIKTNGIAVYHVVETNKMLLGWLINHIMASDKKIGDYLRSLPPAQG